VSLPVGAATGVRWSTAVFTVAKGTAATTGLLGTAAAEEGAGVADAGGVDDAVLPALGVVTLTLAVYLFGLFEYWAMTWYRSREPAGALGSVYAAAGPCT
jgi:hypothetical protein